MYQFECFKRYGQGENINIVKSLKICFNIETRDNHMADKYYHIINYTCHNIASLIPINFKHSQYVLIMKNHNKHLVLSKIALRKLAIV